MGKKVEKTEKEWLAELGPEAYHVLRQKGTERPFSGEYNLHFESGKYHCRGCGEELFDSSSKFNSHCGWPGFDGEIGAGEKIKKIKDTSYGMIRTEIVCASCGGHLGHIFNDGPTESGLRYCVNSLSIKFEKSEPASEKPPVDESEK
ncbi:MAG: peptide-methionine (R)-S-oxide reductase MsrB [Bacteroidota bacterium]